MGVAHCARLLTLFAIKNETVPRCELKETIAKMKAKLSLWSQKHVEIAGRLEKAKNPVDILSLTRELQTSDKFIRALTSQLMSAELQEKSMGTAIDALQKTQTLRELQKEVKRHIPASSKNNADIEDAAWEADDLAGENSDDLMLFGPIGDGQGDSSQFPDLVEEEIRKQLGVDSASDIGHAIASLVAKARGGTAVVQPSAQLRPEAMQPVVVSASPSVVVAAPVAAPESSSEQSAVLSGRTREISESTAADIEHHLLGNDDLHSEADADEYDEEYDDHAAEDDDEVHNRQQQYEFA